jgi:AcrR family transcriptional regulator
MGRPVQPRPSNAQRAPLSREVVLDAAIAVADAQGDGSLTIRSVASHLAVQPMALYYHFANKRDIVDGMLDRVFGEIDLPCPEGDWRVEMARRAQSARLVLRRHPWSIPLLQSGTAPGPATLRHHDALIATLRGAGFSVRMTAHAYALIDSYVYGFALSETSLPINGPQTVAEVAKEMERQHPLDGYPSLAEFSREHIMAPDYDFGEEFGFGLDLILDGLASVLHSAGGLQS